MNSSSSNLLKDDELEPVPLDIEMVKKAINKAKQIIKSSERGDNIVLFWGLTGAGKSSAIIILSGQAVKGYFKGFNVVTEATPTKQEFGVRIQQEIKSGTIYPAMLKLKVKKGQHQVMLWDLPGLGDTRGPSQSLMNSYFIHRIFEFHKNIKLIFTINYYQILANTKGEHLERILDELTRVLGNFDDYSQGVAVMISKTDHRVTKEEIYGYFQQILTLSSISNCQNYKKFIQCVIDKKIPLLLAKQPDIHKIKIQDAVDVTPQYQSLIQQAYTTIAEKLTTVSFPKLNAPAISQKDIQKCRGIVEETHSLIEKYIRAIVEPLKQFITGFYSSAIFSEDLKKVEDGLADCRRMTAFVNKIHQVTQMENIKPNKEKQQLKQRFDDLQRIFESEKYLCKSNVDGTEICEPMIALNDQYIMIRFLNTLQFDEKTIKWKTQSQVLKNLFKDISALQLVNHWENLEQDINNKLKNFLTMYFKNTFVDKIKDETFFLVWKNQYKYFPYFIHHASQSIQHKDSIKYFEELKKDCDKCKIKQVPKIEFIISLLNLNKKYLSKVVSEDTIKILKEQTRKEGNLLIDNVISKNQQFQKVPEALQQYSNSNLHQLLESKQAISQYTKLEQELKQARDSANNKQVMLKTQSNEILQLNYEINRLKQNPPQREDHKTLKGQNSKLLVELNQFKKQNNNLKNLLKISQQKKQKECCCIY